MKRSKFLGPQMQINFESNPSYCQQLHLHRSATKMMSVSETTCTLRYELRSREIYIEEPITSPSPSNPTNGLTSFHNTSSQHDKALSPELFSPTPTSQNKWTSPPPLNDPHNPHKLEEGIPYTITQALRRQIGAMMCVAVHPT